MFAACNNLTYFFSLTLNELEVLSLKADFLARFTHAAWSIVPHRMDLMAYLWYLLRVARSQVKVLDLTVRIELRFYHPLRPRSNLEILQTNSLEIATAFCSTLILG